MVYVIDSCYSTFLFLQKSGNCASVLLLQVMCLEFLENLSFHFAFAFQIELIWGELGQEFKDLLEKGMAGVVASVIAASQRLHSHEHKVYANMNLFLF